MRPDFRILAKLDISVFLMMPCLVIMARYLSSLNSFTEMPAMIFSSEPISKRFTMAMPRPVLPASGIS